ncbi:MAG: ABC transporter ATP-binding protein [Actinomycetota bacterium]|nr:ABC transporter ATP-binding protein [Actinomycetota bacterium]
MLIEARDLQKIYQLSSEVSVAALRGVTLDIESGEFVAIMGQSGSGKSTLMQILGCLDKQSSGSYQLAGVDISSLDDDSLADLRSRKIGFVFQQFNLLPRMTALENVILPLVYAGQAQQQTRGVAALAAVELSDRADHWPNQLSGGQQQRAAIARALVNEPDLILADEPTGALDTKAGGEIMSLLASLNEAGKTVVLITHELYIAQYTKRIITIQDGRIVNDEANKSRKAERL